MVERPEVLAIVPARGGSKSIPRKNLRSFAGHPLLAYSIAAGRQAQSVARVIVSTEDEEIAAVARSYGAEVPFMRPPHLAQDDTPDYPVFLHALTWLAEHAGYRPQVIVQLRPTTPVRPPDCVDRAVGILLSQPEADSVRGVVPSGQNPYKMWRADSHGRLQPLLLDGLHEPYNMPRQSLPPTYWQTGHIDAIRASTILEKNSLSGEIILPLFLDPRDTVDIDTVRDWQRAEWLIMQGDLPAVWPGAPRRRLPETVKLLVLDFDGVLTDDRVWVDEGGNEMVAAHRGDGLGLVMLRESGVAALVLSREANPVVAARCRKLGLDVQQGLTDKGVALRQVIQERRLSAAEVVYVGNDVNDLPCFPLVGCAVAVADAHPDVRAKADILLSRHGGQGAVRELCDMILRRKVKDG